MNYKENILHNALEHWGESSVYFVEFPNGEKKCVKEYRPFVEYKNLIDYHRLHNTLSQHPIHIPTDFIIGDMHINNINFNVLSLGDTIAKICSLQNRKESCVATVPYVPGKTVHDLTIKEPEVWQHIFDAKSQFVQQITKKYPNLNAERLNIDLSMINMKYECNNNEMNIIITDLSSGINKIYTPLGNGHFGPLLYDVLSL